MRSSRVLPASELLFKLLRIAIFYALLVAAWYAVTLAEIWSPFLFPAPDRVFDALRSNIESGVLIEALEGTMKRLAIGYGISFVIGMVLGFLIAYWKWADETVGGIVLGLQSLPSIVWLPMAVLWFGLSERGIIFVVLMGSTFSIALSACAGIRGLPPLLSRAAGTLGASHVQMIRHVILPAMIPAMVQGMKQGWSFAWRSLMAAELLLGVGLGHQLQVGRDLNNISMVFAVMLVIIAVGVAVGLLFGRAEAWVHERWGFGAI